MDEGTRLMGLLFQAAARARRRAVVEALSAHGMEDLEADLGWLLEGVGPAGREETLGRLLRVCRLVDTHMLAGFTPEDLALLAALLRRMLHNLRDWSASGG